MRPNAPVYSMLVTVTGRMMHFKFLKDYGKDASTLLDKSMLNTMVKLLVKQCLSSVTSEFLGHNNMVPCILISIEFYVFK